MKIALVTNVRERKGLYVSSKVWVESLTRLGHEVEAVQFDEPKDQRGLGYGAAPFDLAIYDEVDPNRWHKGIAPRIWYSPHPEWHEPERSLSGIERVLCKTKHALWIFAALTPKVVFTNFWTPQRVPPGKKVPNSWALSGGSSLRGMTPEVVATLFESAGKGATFWPIGFRFGLGGRVMKQETLSDLHVDDGLATSMYMLAPSQTEGWGHLIWEALLAGCCVITTDAPPMNAAPVHEVVEATWVGKMGVAPLWGVDLDDLADKIRSAKLAVPNSTAIAKIATEANEANRKHFEEELADLLSEPVLTWPKRGLVDVPFSYAKDAPEPAVQPPQIVQAAPETDDATVALAVALRRVLGQAAQAAPPVAQAVPSAPETKSIYVAVASERLLDQPIRKIGQTYVDPMLSPNTIRIHDEHQRTIRWAVIAPASGPAARGGTEGTRTEPPASESSGE